MELFLLVVFSLYLALVILLIAGWTMAMSSARNALTEVPESRITVIVPVRNEQHNIPGLLQSLLTQEYSNFDVIIVDDHSTDRTREVVQSTNISKIQLIGNPGHGKKSALTTGVHHAQGDIISTTDADCVLPPGWLKSINRAFIKSQTKLSFGGVRIEQDGSLFSKLQSIEFASLIGSAGAMAALGSPIMCNGANLAYRKSVFKEVNGFEGNLEVASGDDEFLMRKIHQKYSDGVVFDNAAHRIVTTAPASTARTFIQQRIRWASKWKHNTSFSAIVMALFIVLVQVTTVGLWVIAILDGDILFLSGLLVKLILEAFFLYRVCTFLNARWSTISFLALQMIYPFYVLAIGITSNVLSFRWKDRERGLAPSKHT
jgi:biofilm PGA synthesis N-glycosyltransferase PgaC